MTPGTEEIMKHIARFRITTIDAVQTLYFRDKTREAARVCLYRLVSDGYLTRFEIRSRSFYRLTPKGCRTLETSQSLSRSFDTQTLVERYGVLVYCTLREPKRTRLMPQEFHDFFPALSQKRGIKPELQHYFIDQVGEELRLGRIVVDGGMPTSRLVRKCHELVQEALESALYAIIAQGLYSLVLLTAEETKQRALQAAFQQQPLPLPVAVESAPELKHILS